MKITIIIIYLFFSFSVSAQTAISNSEALITTKRKGYEITHPTKWTIDTSKTFGMDLMVRSPRVDTADDFSENVNVIAQDLKGQGYNLLKMGQESETQIKTMITDVVLIESKLDTTGSTHHYRLHYRGRHGKFQLTTIQQFYYKNEIGYAVTVTIETKNEKDYIGIGEKIISSFKIQ